MAKSKLLVFCLDALCTLDLDEMKKLPNFSQLFLNGSYIKHVEPVYPSLTYPCHCSILTGNYVKNHGIYHNEIVSIEDPAPPWFNQRSDIHCKTLMDYAKEGGYTTCSLSWPVSARADIDLNMPMIVPIAYTGDHPEHFLENGNGSQELLDRYFWKYGRFLMGPDRSLDLFTMALAPDIIRDYHQPDVMLVKMCDLDTVRHIHGIDNDFVKAQLAKHDKEFGVLLESVRRYGDFEHTNFVILGDHGQQDIKKNLNMNIVLRDAGFIRTDENGKLLSWDAYCHSASLSAWIVLHDRSDKAMWNKVYNFLKNLQADPQYNIGYVYTAEEAEKEFGLTGPLDFVIEGKEPMSFSATLAGRDIFQEYLPEGWHSSKASHGHLPFRDETTTFIASGPDVAKNVVIERSSMVNEAPTMAAMLGLKMKDTDGHVLKDMLRR